MWVNSLVELSFALLDCKYKKMIEKALLVAISYPGTNAALRGCVHDQEQLYRYLRDSCPDCEIRVLSDDQSIQAPVTAVPTKFNILRQIEWLTKGATEESHLWISYSGHGGSQISRPIRVAPLRWRAMGNRSIGAVRASEKQSPMPSQWRSHGRRRRRAKRIRNIRKQEEIDGRDETIVPSDYNRRGQITDDVLRKRLVDTLPKGCKLTAFFDCCHSGTVLDLRHNWTDTKVASDTPNIRKKEHKAIDDSEAHVLMLSGCLDNQTAADAYIDAQYCGATTQAFLHHMQRLSREVGAQSSRTFGDNLIDDRNLDTLEELLHSMNRWMRSNNFAQRPQISLGRNELVSEAVQTFFPILKQ